MASLTPSLPLSLPVVAAIAASHEQASVQQFLEPLVSALAAPAGASPSVDLIFAQKGSVGEGVKVAQQKVFVNPLLPLGKVMPLRQRPIFQILQHAQELQAGLMAIVWDSHTAKTDAVHASQLSDAASKTGWIGDRLLAGMGQANGGEGLLLGLVRRAPCPVLTVQTETLQRQPILQWRRILLVIDDQATARSAIAMTRQLIAAGAEKVTLLSVHAPVSTRYLYGPFGAPSPNWHLDESLQQVQRDRCQKLLQKAIAALQTPTVTLETLTRCGAPGSVICQVAEQQQVDLIVMGCDRSVGNLNASGEAGHRAIHLNVTGNFVIHQAKCPVLLCRSQGTGWQPPSCSLRRKQTFILPWLFALHKSSTHS